MEGIQEKESKKSGDSLSIAYEPTPKFIDLEELARQQNYNGKRLAHRLENVNGAIWKEENIYELMECLNS